MAPRKPQNVAHIGYIGYCEAVPSTNQVSTYSSSSNKGRQMKSSTELQSATKTSFKSVKGKASTNYKQTYTSGEFVDKSTGGIGYKEEMKYSRTSKYQDKELGYTHEYEAQVKLKHVAYPTKSTGSENKQINYYDDDDDYYY